MAITMGALYQVINPTWERLGEIAEYPSNYAPEQGFQAERDATDVAEAMLLHLQQVVKFLEYSTSEVARNDSPEMEVIRFGLTHSAGMVSSAIGNFDDPPDEDEDEDEESESDESAEA
jgi:hypothetical protein